MDFTVIETAQQAGGFLSYSANLARSTFSDDLGLRSRAEDPPALLKYVTEGFDPEDPAITRFITNLKPMEMLYGALSAVSTARFLQHRLTATPALQRGFFNKIGHNPDPILLVTKDDWCPSRPLVQ